MKTRGDVEMVKVYYVSAARFVCTPNLTEKHGRVRQIFRSGVGGLLGRKVLIIQRFTRAIHCLLYDTNDAIDGTVCPFKFDGVQCRLRTVTKSRDGKPRSVQSIR